ncbi:hypothetical protein ABZ816_21065 [Actinosynnema sp. NPDC047251]|uniref:Uncharacterized protein n=1 Tax=Saccharothrix espanaensis (strain ATCC 51144 / DSM 44229 / JCM 9112 / NBRC 15066 / NRRL 15764) TaxID=1179773 RepID=K0K470_SACES|nr:hypothetical protein [Saccharothrix espanaensis]CCH35055.1 hypothetical protein BN6_78370 [Saccharothrix espanaensis DSM 44229]
MSNDDNRRRQDGSTAKLSVADLLARREAETQPIPRITDEETIRFTPATNLSGRELHITELLRREGRAGEEERGGGLSVPKLVAMASGGVVLAGAVAFTATNLLSSPDERPLAEVRYDNRQAARSTNTIGNDLAAAAAKQQQAQPAADETTEAPTTAAPTQTTTQRPRATQQPAPPPTTTTTEQAPPPVEQPPTTTVPPTTEVPPPPTTTPPTTSAAPPPASGSTTPAPSSGESTTPTTPTTPTAPTTPGVDLGLDLGGILDPLGGFDFFSPAA